MNRKFFSKLIIGLGLAIGIASHASADAVYASYDGSQLGFTIRDVNTLNQYIWHDTGVSASGIAVDSNNNVYMPSTNHIRKYDLSGNLLVNMTFPDSGIIYTDVAVNGNRLYASYKGSQKGVTTRDTGTLNQLSYFNTGVNANGIAVDANNNIYIAAANQIIKYNSTGTVLVKMTFPISSINYTGVAINGNFVYACYTGSQQGVTKRDINTLNQVQYFNTGINASGISLDAGGNIFLTAGNHIRKYNNGGTMLKDMTFPISSINYTGVAIK